MINNFKINWILDCLERSNYHQMSFYSNNFAKIAKHYREWCPPDLFDELDEHIVYEILKNNIYQEG